MANITRHAYDGATDRPVEVRGEPQPGGGVCITVRDWGAGINPTDRPPRHYRAEEPGGLGLICLTKLMDDIRFVPQPDGMLLTMVKRKRQGSRVKGQQ